ncbi:MAG TPA: hypothetical protein VG796_06845 [Verrucomicrobiales bacterium]|jgi:hypothetical protein|nr:hypothetical protein [Verrucomicrobiales bacterium]
MTATLANFPSGKTGRIATLAEDEYDRLLGALKTNIVPALELLAEKLRTDGFDLVSVRCSGGTAEIFAECCRSAIQGILKFQLHWSLAVLLKRDPVHWSFTVYHRNGGMSSVPGRLSGLHNTEGISAIMADFQAACQSARPPRTSPLRRGFWKWFHTWRQSA